MSQLATEWWYSLIRAAPQPESGEAVNVAVIVGNGALEGLTFEPGLPRLAPLCSRRDRLVYDGILRQVAKEITEYGSLQDLLQALGPQLMVSEQRRLFGRPDAGTLSGLRRRFLVQAHETEDEHEARVLMEGRKRLANEISRKARLGIREIVEHPTPARLYRRHSEWAAGIRIPKLGRAVRGDRRDLLIDAVMLDPSPRGLRTAIEVATARIHRAFWYYRKLRAEIGELEQREIRTTGMLITPPGAEGPEVRDARDFILSEWHRTADHVIDTRDGSTDLEKDLAWAVGDTP